MHTIIIVLVIWFAGSVPLGLLVAHVLTLTVCTQSSPKRQNAIALISYYPDKHFLGLPGQSEREKGTSHIGVSVSNRLGRSKF